VTKNDATTEVHLDSSFNVGGGPGSGRQAAEWFEDAIRARDLGLTLRQLAMGRLIRASPYSNTPGGARA
jgi:hypothetical protein